MARIAVALCSGVLVVSASHTEELFKHDCRNYLLGETNAPKDRLAYLCDRQGFSAKACAGALATVPRHLTRQNIEPFCAVLVSSPGSDKVIARLKHRQGHKGESREVQLVNLDKAVQSKKGQPDYLIASDDPPMFEDPPAPLSHPPPSPVDMTIAQPPDADGNPYNTPEWGVNGQQAVVSIPASSGGAPLESAPVPPPAEAPAESAPVPPQAEAPAEAEAPRAEAAPELTDPAEVQAAPEDSAEAQAEVATPEGSSEAPTEPEAAPPAEEEAPEDSAEGSADTEAEPEMAIEDDAEVPAEEGAASSQ